MEQVIERWQKVEEMIEMRFGKKPSLEAALFLIGINETGLNLSKNFTKEEKQDLMHVGVCTLLAPHGFYKKQGIDKEGWPIFVAQTAFQLQGIKEQEALLKSCIPDYFGL